MKKLFLVLILAIAVAGTNSVNAQCNGSSSSAHCHVSVSSPTYNYTEVWDYWYINPNVTISYSTYLQANGRSQIYTDYDYESFYSSDGTWFSGSLHNGGYGYLELTTTIYPYSTGYIEINAYW